MPADARSLLRAAAAQKRGVGLASSSASSSSSSGNATSTTAIPDRFASYHRKTGALRCSACDLTIKHESLWASHAASKSHRARTDEVRRAEAEQEARAAAAATEREERERVQKEEEERGAQAAATAVAGSSSGAKRKGGGDDDSQRGADGNAAEKRVRLAGEVESVDPEWERFQREVIAQASESDAHQQADRAIYSANATIEVAPRLRQVPGGADDAEEEAEEEQEEEEEETEEEKRARLDREEREEILARFEEEQRIQDEANER